MMKWLHKTLQPEMTDEEWKTHFSVETGEIMKFTIKNRFTGKVIFEKEAASAGQSNE